jgi:hypothetical protein
MHRNTVVRGTAWAMALLAGLALAGRPAEAGKAGRRNTALILGAVGAYELLQGHTGTGIAAAAGAAVAYKRYRDADDEWDRYRGGSSRSAPREGGYRDRDVYGGSSGRSAPREEGYRDPDVYRTGYDGSYDRNRSYDRSYDRNRSYDRSYDRDDRRVRYRRDRDDVRSRDDRGAYRDRYDRLDDRTRGGKVGRSRYDDGRTQGGYQQGGGYEQGGYQQGGYQQGGGYEQGGYQQGGYSRVAPSKAATAKGSGTEGPALSAGIAWTAELPGTGWIWTGITGSTG